MPDSLVTCASCPTVHWLPWSGCSGSDQLAVVCLSLPDRLPWETYVTSVLQPEELARARRYHRPDDQRRSALARAVVRIVAGRYLDLPPAQVKLTVGEKGKLQLAHAGGLHLNVSHAGTWVALAMGRGPVGIDLERIDPSFDFGTVSDASFGTEEQQQLAANPDPRRFFYQLWTRKEAFVKATGRGVDEAFHQIPALEGDHRIDAELAGRVVAWQSWGFWIADAYPAAVVHTPISATPAFYRADESLFEPFVTSAAGARAE